MGETSGTPPVGSDAPRAIPIWLGSRRCAKSFCRFATDFATAETKMEIRTAALNAGLPYHAEHIEIVPSPG